MHPIRFVASASKLTLATGMLLSIVLPAAAVAQSPSLPSAPDPFTLVATLDQTTTGLVQPHAFAIGPDGNLYVADSGSSIRVISPTGQPIRSWGTKGSGPGALDFGPRASIAIDPAGLVYVLEGANHRVQVFQPDGTFVRQFGGFGGKPGQFVDPMAVMVDPDSNAYVIDDSQQHLTKFDATGAVQWTLDASSGPDPDLVGHMHRGAFDGHGLLWLTNDGNSRVVAIDGDGHKVDAFGEEGTGPGQFQGTFSVAFDASGNAYVDECADRRLQVFDPQHQLIGVMDAPAGLPLGDNYAFGPDGLLYALAGGDHCAGPAPTGAAADDILVMRVAGADQPKP